MQRALALAVVALLSLPGSVRAQEASSSDAVAPAIAPVDDLGRPWPDPQLVREAKARTVLGATFVGVGAGLMVGGLFYGSALAREEIPRTTASGVGAGALAGGGLGLLSAGLPTLSVGVYTTKQLDRTIKGAEKVPRTVANERRFWNAVMSEHMGRTIAINGGGTLLMGVVVLAGVSATVDTEFYKPWYWAAVAGTFAGGAGLVAAGILIERGARAKQEAIREEVDPYRQRLRQELEDAKGAVIEDDAPVVAAADPILGVPMPAVAPIPPTPQRPGGVSIGLSWAVAF